jgi:calcium/calmodulin-dependent protein kinase I
MGSGSSSQAGVYSHTQCSTSDSRGVGSREDVDESKTNFGIVPRDTSPNQTDEGIPLKESIRQRVEEKVGKLLHGVMTSTIPGDEFSKAETLIRMCSPKRKMCSPKRKQPNGPVRLLHHHSLLSLQKLRNNDERITFAEPLSVPTEFQNLLEVLTAELLTSSPSSTDIVFRRHWTLQKLTLGSGSSSIVHECVSSIDPTIKVACKVLDKTKLRLSMARKEKIIRLARNEVRIMKRLQHPCVSTFIACYETPTRIYILMELCEGGELFEHLIDSPDGLSEEKVKVLAKCLGEGLAYMHDRGVMHRDIKPENILLKEKNDLSSVKFIDFGLSRAATNSKSFLGTAGYVAPEMFHGGETSMYTSAVDMWALGVTLYVAISGYMPFDDSDNEDDSLCRGVKTALKQKVTFSDDIFASVSEECKLVLAALLSVDPSTRLSARDLLSSEWLGDS